MTPRLRRTLPEAELELLALLEHLGECDVAALREALAPVRPLARASVITLLRRLEHRGLVRRREAPSGRSHLYSARGASGLAQHLRSLASRLFGHDRIRLVATLFEGEPPTAEELEELSRWVTRMRRPKGKGGEP
ncbi:MAG TPA: BlaI/MecI/CopY family transcriptional regulator [Thermoanaerobaculia bacterium]|nr:BlaI/MecI/CopY family transcriptional regulator [Thermoanaerobaculia bacterium]